MKFYKKKTIFFTKSLCSAAMLAMKNFHSQDHTSDFLVGLGITWMSMGGGQGSMRGYETNMGKGWSIIFKKSGDFPGGSVVKNPPTSAGDTGLIPGPGRSHMPRSN